MDTKLTWVAEGGALVPLPVPARTYVDLDVAPDGRRAAGGVVEAGRFVLRVIDFESHNDDVVELPGSTWEPRWNPDGRRLAVRSMKGGQCTMRTCLISPVGR